MVERWSCSLGNTGYCRRMTETASYDVLKFGNEKQPIVIIDNFVQNPKVLVANAASKKYEPRGPYYPGVRAQAEIDFLRETSPLLTQILKSEFGFTKGADLVECNYSLVTTHPDDLMPIQCLPHFDGVDAGRIAVLHYLSQPKQGGTAFYRHKPTGFETVTADRFKEFEASLNQHAQKKGLPPKRYFTGNTDQFERIGSVDASYNRCLVYQGITLHSGDIPEDLPFDKNPATGRLTVNTFLARR